MNITNGLANGLRGNPALFKHRMVKRGVAERSLAQGTRGLPVVVRSRSCWQITVIFGIHEGYHH